MSVILVVETDGSYAQRIREAMETAGVAVEVCGDAESAARSAALRPPRLLVASSAVPDIRSLLGRFARARGGPGTVAMIPTTLVGRVSAADYHADAILPKPFSSDEAREVLLPMLAEDAEARRQLSSDEIFGDVVAEVEGPHAARPRPAPAERPRASSSDDIERKLEETLSGVIPWVDGRRAKPGDGDAAAPPRAKAPAEPSDEIDELLDRTLSSLDLPRRTKKRTDAPRPPTPAPGPSALATTTLPKIRADAEPPPAVDEPPRAEAPAVEAPPRVETPPPAAVEAPPRVETPPPAAVDEPIFEPLPDLEPPPAPPPAPQGSALAPAAPDTSVPEHPAPPAAPMVDAFRTQRLTIVPARESTEGEIFGDYTLLRRIAIGGMAEVWQARRRGVEGFQKTVAIKKILSHLTGSSDFVTMFIDEAKLAAQLTHNNIIQIYDLGKVGEDFFIAMEYVDGMDVRTLLATARAKRRPLPARLSLLIASSVARALDYAHRKRDFDHRALGLVHRDVSPQNVLISYEGEIKLCDFGIVKAVAKASTTQMGALKGKLQYMSPEQAWGKPVDARSDVFSLGSVLFEMLTGTRLFAGDSEIGVLDAVRECRVRSPRELEPTISAEVERLVLRALAKAPEERYQTAGELEEDLKTVIGGLEPMPSQGELASYMQDLAAAPQPEEGVDDGPAAPSPAPTPVPGFASAPAVDGPAAQAAPAPRPEPAAKPEPPPRPASSPLSAAAAAQRSAGAKKKRGSTALRLLIAAVIVVVVGAVVYFVLRSTRGGAREAPVTVATPPPAEPAASEAPPEGAVEPAAEDAEEIDLKGLVDEELARQREEIKKKLDEEFEAKKKKLEKELEAAKKGGSTGGG